MQTLLVKALSPAKLPPFMSHLNEMPTETGSNKRCGSYNGQQLMLLFLVMSLFTLVKESPY